MIRGQRGKAGYKTYTQTDNQQEKAFFLNLGRSNTGFMWLKDSGENSQKTQSPDLFESINYLTEHILGLTHILIILLCVHQEGIKKMF